MFFSDYDRKINTIFITPVSKGGFVVTLHNFVGRLVMSYLGVTRGGGGLKKHVLHIL